MAMATATSAAVRSQSAIDVDFALPSDPSPIRVAHSTASFRSLATVELQLLMHCCDQRTLLSLARCRRFTLQAASNDFAWRCLSPLELTFIHPLAQDTDAGARQQLHCCLRPPPPPSHPLPLPLPLAERVTTSLLRFCDIAIQWNYGGIGDHSFSAVPDAELDALAAIPRLRALDIWHRGSVGPAHVESLVRRASLCNLTALACHGRHLDETSIRALAGFCPRLSTVTIMRTFRADSPLHLLPALTDLTAFGCHADGQPMTVALRCTGLRRLDVSLSGGVGCTSREVHTALLSPNLRTLEHLVVDGINAFHADGRQRPPAQLDWAAAFANLPVLRSLRLDFLRGIDELLVAIAAGCTQLHSLQISSDVGFTGPASVAVALPSVAVLSGLLTRQPSLRSVMLILPTRDRFISVRSSIGRHAQLAIWLGAFEGLNAFAALHPQRLTVRFECQGHTSWQARTWKRL